MSEAPIASSSTLPVVDSVSSKRSDDGDSSDDGFGLGLDELLPEPESPPIPPFTFSTYRPSKSALESNVGKKEEDDDVTPLSMPEGRDQMIIRLVGSHPLWGHYLWNTARVASDCIYHLDISRNQKILELGAGAGLPSLTAAMCGASKVVITDYPDQSLVDNMIWNADVNLDEGVRGNVDVEGFVWGAKVDSLLEKSGGEGYDVLVLSDLVFNHSQHSALVASCNSLISRKPRTETSHTPCLLVFITHHRPRFQEADMDFFRVLLEAEGDWDYCEWEPVVTGPMFEEDPGDRNVRGTVRRFKAWQMTEEEKQEKVKDLEGFMKRDRRTGRSERK